MWDQCDINIESLWDQFTIIRYGAIMVSWWNQGYRILTQLHWNIYPTFILFIHHFFLKNIDQGKKLNLILLSHQQESTTLSVCKLTFLL